MNKITIYLILIISILLFSVTSKIHGQTTNEYKLLKYVKNPETEVIVVKYNTNDQSDTCEIYGSLLFQADGHLKLISKEKTYLIFCSQLRNLEYYIISKK